jgi:hypothetical protein
MRRLTEARLHKTSTVLVRRYWALAKNLTARFPPAPAWGSSWSSSVREERRLRPSETWGSPIAVAWDATLIVSKSGNFALLYITFPFSGPTGFRIFSGKRQRSGPVWINRLPSPEYHHAGCRVCDWQSHDVQLRNRFDFLYFGRRSVYLHKELYLHWWDETFNQLGLTLSHIRYRRWSISLAQGLSKNSKIFRMVSPSPRWLKANCKPS